MVEDMMHKSLRDVLRACRIDLKKHLSKREKWVREWPGQVSPIQCLFQDRSSTIGPVIIAEFNVCVL